MKRLPLIYWNEHLKQVGDYLVWDDGHIYSIKHHESIYLTELNLYIKHYLYSISLDYLIAFCFKINPLNKQNISFKNGLNTHHYAFNLEWC